MDFLPSSRKGYEKKKLKKVSNLLYTYKFKTFFRYFFYFQLTFFNEINNFLAFTNKLLSIFGTFY